MRIETWTSGYKVEACDWYDGEHIYFCVQYFSPGSSLSSPPAFERSILISNLEWYKVQHYTDSIASAVMGLSEKLMGKSAFPLLSEYRNGTQTVKNGITLK